MILLFTRLGMIDEGIRNCRQISNYCDQVGQDKYLLKNMVSVVLRLRKINCIVLHNVFLLLLNTEHMHVWFM